MLSDSVMACPDLSTDKIISGTQDCPNAWCRSSASGFPYPAHQDPALSLLARSKKSSPEHSSQVSFFVCRLKFLPTEWLKLPIAQVRHGIFETSPEENFRPFGCAKHATSDPAELFWTWSGQQFLEFQSKLVVSGQATIVHGQNLADTPNRQFRRAGQTQDKIVRSELFQFSDGVDPEKGESLASLSVVLEDDVKGSVNRDSGTTEFSGRRGIPNTGRDRRLSHTLFASRCLRLRLRASSWP